MLGKLLPPEPGRKASIFSRHLSYSETLILYFPMDLVWSSRQEDLNLKDPQSKLPQCLCHSPVALQSAHSSHRLLRSAAFLIAHLLGVCLTFHGFTFNCPSVPVSGQANILTAKQAVQLMGFSQPNPLAGEKGETQELFRKLPAKLAVISLGASVHSSPSACLWS